MDKSSSLRVFTICFYCFTAISTVNCTRNKLLLVVFSGFQYNYTQYTETPNFDKFKSSGTYAPNMQGVFPTKTVPSVYSIATGLYPESHGLVGDIFYDPVLNKTFEYTLTDADFDKPSWNEAGEPIWVTAKNKNLKTFSFNPSFSNFDVKLPIEVLVNEDFVTLFFDEPRKVGHKTGPESNETKSMIKSCDNIMGTIFDEIQRKHLTETVNIIVLSDHGMAASVLDNNTVINLYNNNISSLIEVSVCDGGFCNILPKTGSLDIVFTHLRYTPHVTVLKKDDLPGRLHYQQNKRILPIIVIADEGWSLVANESEVNLNKDNKGSYGFDNKLMSMKPFFMARGPDIRCNYTSPVFSQVDVYPLLCKLLNLTAYPQINGSLKVVGKMITNLSCSNMTASETIKITESTTNKITESTTSDLTITDEPSDNNMNVSSNETSNLTNTDEPFYTNNNISNLTTTVVNISNLTTTVAHTTVTTTGSFSMTKSGANSGYYSKRLSLIAIGACLGLSLFVIIYICNTKCTSTTKKPGAKDKFPYLGYEIVKNE